MASSGHFVVVDEDKYQVKHHHKPAADAENHRNTAAHKTPSLHQGILDNRQYLLLSKHVLYRLKIDVFHNQFVDFGREILHRVVVLGILRKHVSHLAHFAHNIWDKECHNATKHDCQLEKRYKHGERVALDVQELAIPLHKRVGDICDETCHQKREEHASQIVEQPHNAHNNQCGENDANHPVEGVDAFQIGLCHSGIV